MENLRGALRLYAITNGGNNLLEQVQKAVDGGITMVQIREKNRSLDELIKLAEPIVAYCREKGIPCIIDDDVEAARVLHANGVHVGQEDTPVQTARRILGERAIIGTSAHNVEEAKKAAADGADYIGCGALFPSRTKSDTIPLSIDILRVICKAVQIPVVAIGGINAENAQKLEGTGVSGIAVISAIFSQKNIQKAARQMRELADRYCRRS